MNETLFSYLNSFPVVQEFISSLSKSWGYDATSTVTFVVFFVACFIVINILAAVGSFAATGI